MNTKGLAKLWLKPPGDVQAISARGTQLIICLIAPGTKVIPRIGAKI